MNTTSNALTDVITNSGDEPVTLAIDATNAAFALKWPVSPDAIALDPKGAFTLSSTFHPTAASSASTSFPLTVASGHVCGGVPSIAAHGLGTSGAIGIQPGSIDFGYVDCGTTSTLAVADRTVTITNTGNVPMTWQASLRRGVHSFYDLTTSNTTRRPAFMCAT